MKQFLLSLVLLFPISSHLIAQDTEEENETLAKILSYHVTMGSVMSSELSDGMEINSLIRIPWGSGAVG